MLAKDLGDKEERRIITFTNGNDPLENQGSIIWKAFTNVRNYSVSPNIGILGPGESIKVAC